MKKAKREIRPVVYVSGPMRGYAQHNFPAFDEAAKKLRAKGYNPWTPADNDRRHGIDEHSVLSDKTIAKLILEDLHIIAEKATCVYALPGHQDSVGCAVELALARFCGKPIYRRYKDVPILRKR